MVKNFPIAGKKSPDIKESYLEKVHRHILVNKISKITYKTDLVVCLIPSINISSFHVLFMYLINEHFKVNIAHKVS